MADQYKYGNYYQRLLARLADMLLLTLPWAIGFNMIVARSADIQSVIGNFISYMSLVFFPTLFVAFFYSALMIHFFGTTIGKFALGLKVVDSGGNHLTFKRAFFRQTFGYMLSGFIFGLGFLAVIKNKNKQGWHDEAVGSFVVYNNKLWFLGIVFIFILIAIHLYFNFSSTQLFYKLFVDLSNMTKLLI